MSFKWDDETQKRIDRNRRNEKIIGAIVVVAMFSLAIGIRLLIVGGDMTCFWAQDVGTCMAILRK